MSWGIAILVVIMMVIVALVARATASKTKRRFGLKEAEAASSTWGTTPTPPAP